MEFKEGDRVRVLRLNTNEVDFYATLKDYNDGHPFILSDCSDGRFECCSVFKPNTGEVGLNRWDYYVLAEDEEDTKGGNNMPTIKRKVEMNLPQLIEWAWENNVKDKTFCSVKDDRGVFYEVGFYDDGSFYSEDFLVSELVFTVEIEEEITEDTKLYLVERYISSYEDFKLKYKSHQNRSIKSILENNQPHLKTTHFYTEVNNELILIWKNGKLVE